MGPAGSPRAPCAGMLAKKGHTCKQEAFATRLEERVNAQWPCATAHKVTNLCQRAKGSNFFANWAAAWPNDEALTSLAQADVVVVETALNDMSETEGGILLSGRLTGWTRSTVDMVGYWTELLLRVLLSLPRRPALLWLTASWTPTKQPPYHRDAEAAHHAVLRHYGVAQLSMLGALGIENSASAREWAKQQYHTDRYSHVSALGHKLLAAVISHHLTTELHREMRPNAGSAVTPGALPLPMIVDEARIRAYTSSAHQVSRIDFTRAGGAPVAESHVAAIGGFTLLEDVPGKPGLVATRVHAHALLRILGPSCADASQALPAGAEGLTSIGYLATYLSAGAFNASILATSARARGGGGGGCLCEAADVTQAQQLAVQRVDCRAPVGRNVSIYSAVEVRWRTPKALWLPSNSAGWCLWLHITTEVTGKVKLLDITTMRASVEPAPGLMADTASKWLQAASGHSQHGVCGFTSANELGCALGQRQGIWTIETPAQWPLAAAFCLERCASCAGCKHLSISLENTECGWFVECPKLTPMRGWKTAAVERNATREEEGSRVHAR